MKNKKIALRVMSLLLAVFSLYLSAEVTTPASDSKTVVAKMKKQKKENALIKQEEAATGTENKSVKPDVGIKVTFVELGATKCIPCKMMQPIMKEIEAEYGSEVKVTFHDVWEDRAPAMKYNINLIPTQVFLDKNGKEYYRHEGFFPKEEILKILEMQGVKIKEK